MTRFPAPDSGGTWHAIAPDGTAVKLTLYPDGLPSWVYNALTDDQWPDSPLVGRWFGNLSRALERVRGRLDVD